MDSTTARLVDFALDNDFASLPRAAVHECKRRLIDTFACAIGSFGHPLSATARRLAGDGSAGPQATVWGTSTRTAAETAAFVNGVSLRVGENSDTFIGHGGGGHPSDMIAAFVAAAEGAGAGGRPLIEAVTIGYDVYGHLMDIANLGERGWDQAVHAVLGAVLGAGKLMRLSRAQLGHAVSLAIAPNMALRQTRHGELSSWKGCAGANASRNALFAARLAQLGVEGPDAIFEGKQGLWSVAGRFEWPPASELGGERVVARTSLKSLPVCYHTQAAALAALELRPEVAAERIEQVVVETYRVALEMAGNDPGQWAPRTPESADHSLPFVVATALGRGTVEPWCFGADRLDDAGVVGLMRKVTVREDAALTALWPQTAPARITIRHADGSVSAEVRHPKGHVRNPMTDAEVGAKFASMAAPRLGDEGGRRALQALWRIDEAHDLSAQLPALLAPEAALA